MRRIKFIKKKLLIFILIVIVIGLIILPTKISWYEEKKDIPTSNLLFDITPPIGGCFDVCFGTVQQKLCADYSRKYLSCEAKCYGLKENVCSGIFKSFLEKFK